MKCLRGLTFQLATACALIACTILVLQMLLLCADIASRNLLSRPISGVPELLQLSLVAMVFLALPWTIENRGLVRSDFLIRRNMNNRQGLVRKINLLANTLGCIVFALASLGVAEHLISAWRENYFVGYPGVFTAPTWPTLLCVFVGCLLSSLSFCLDRMGERTTRSGPPN